MNECLCLDQLGDTDVARQLPKCTHGLCTKCLEKLMSHQGYQASEATSDNSSSNDSDTDWLYDIDEPQRAAPQVPDYPPEFARMTEDEVSQVKQH